jgi:hypothetical protein
MDKDADIAKTTRPTKIILPQIRYGESVERKSKLKLSIRINNGKIIASLLNYQCSSVLVHYTTKAFKYTVFYGRIGDLGVRHH